MLFAIFWRSFTMFFLYPSKVRDVLLTLGMKVHSCNSNACLWTDLLSIVWSFSLCFEWSASYLGDLLISKLRFSLSVCFRFGVKLHSRISSISLLSLCEIGVLLLDLLWVVSLSNPLIDVSSSSFLTIVIDFLFKLGLKVHSSDSPVIFFFTFLRTWNLLGLDFLTSVLLDCIWTNLWRFLVFLELCLFVFLLWRLWFEVLLISRLNSSDSSSMSSIAELMVGFGVLMIREWATGVSLAFETVVFSIRFWGESLSLPCRYSFKSHWSTLGPSIVTSISWWNCDYRNFQVISTEVLVRGVQFILTMRFLTGSSWSIEDCSEWSSSSLHLDSAFLAMNLFVKGSSLLINSIAFW